MEIKVNFLDKLRQEAKFDDFTVMADQPIRYKGDGSAPGQVADLGAKTEDVGAMGSGDPADYFERTGKGDNLFKIVERRYRAKSPEFRASTGNFPQAR
jgi:hypothetical protein